MSRDLLLDTHTFIWLMEGEATLKETTRELIRETCKKHFLYVSSISFWERGRLTLKKKLSFTLPVKRWVDQALSLPFLKVVDVTPEIALESCSLPGRTV